MNNNSGLKQNSYHIFLAKVHELAAMEAASDRGEEIARIWPASMSQSGLNPETPYAA
jgi:hypothetical protein